MAATGNSNPISSGTLSDDLDALQDTMNGKELQLYTYSAQTSFNQSLAQTLAQLATNAAKAKPQV